MIYGNETTTKNAAKYFTEKLSNVDVSTFTDSVSIDLYDTEPFGSAFNLFFADCFLLATDVLFESAFR